MRRLRDVFYINANFNANYFIYYGMEFREFIKYEPIGIDNIMITDGSYIADAFNYSWFFETANGKKSIQALTEEDIYGLGNFHWVDYKNEEALNACLPEERAEVLYLSHFGKPIKAPFFERIGNHYFYLSHDDGWHCRLYCKDMQSFREIIANKIIDSFATNKRRKIYPMGEDIKKELLELTKQGLLIDFSQIYRDKSSISLNIYAIGHFTDMDEMYNNLERNKQKASVRGTLEHTNKAWRLQMW